MVGDGTGNLPIFGALAPEKTNAIINLSTKNLHVFLCADCFDHNCSLGGEPDGFHSSRIGTEIIEASGTHGAKSEAEASAVWKRREVAQGVEIRLRGGIIVRRAGDVSVDRWRSLWERIGESQKGNEKGKEVKDVEFHCGDFGNVKYESGNDVEESLVWL